MMYIVFANMSVCIYIENVFTVLMLLVGWWGGRRGISFVKQLECPHVGGGDLTGALQFNFDHLVGASATSIICSCSKIQNCWTFLYQLTQAVLT